MQGMAELPTNRVDRFFEETVHDYLFFPQCNPMIIDLVSININRGRDHGVPAYIYFVEYCSGVHIECWEDLYQFIEEDFVEELKTIYK